MKNITDVNHIVIYYFNHIVFVQCISICIKLGQFKYFT